MCKILLQVGPAVRALGLFEDGADVEGIFTVLQRWTHILETNTSEVGYLGRPPLINKSLQHSGNMKSHNQRSKVKVSFSLYRSR